jgi:1-acyl-sn-glycerol-3-phosphate acyltransferase
MLLIRSLLADLIMYVSILVFGVVFAPFALWSRAGAYRGIWAFCPWMFWVFRVLCGITVEVRGPVPQGEVIVCSKHMSFLDIMIHANTLPQARFIMKNELKWAPILGAYAMRIGSSPVKRGKKSAAMKDMVEHVAAGSREAPGQTVIYPQGTRVLPGSTLPYKIGAGVLYQRLGLPCVPAATNVGVLWGRRSPYRHPGKAIVEYLPEIEPGLPIDRFMARIEEVVESNSNRLMAEIGWKGAGGGD